MESFSFISFYILLMLSLVTKITSTPLQGEYVGNFKYTNYTMDEIKKLDVITCKTDSDCPEFSSGCELYTVWNGEKEVEYNLCEMNFMCHQNSSCYFLHNSATYYINVKSIEYGIAFVSNDTLATKEIEEKDKVIFHSCSRGLLKHNLCETDTCQDNSNCFSNNCHNGICVTNHNDPAYFCRLDWAIETKKVEMQCKLANGEKCSHNSDCDHINVCDDKLEVCASPLVAENHGDRKLPDYLFIAGVAITIVIILALIALISLFVMSCAYVALDELKNILFNISDDYRQLEDTNNN